MTENQERFEELKDAVCRMVCIAEDAICREGFEELDNAGAEIIGCLEEIQKYRAIGTVEECRTAVERMEAESKTNADRIRAMSNADLAEFFTTFKNTFGEEYEGKMSCLEWLQRETQ